MTLRALAPFLLLVSSCATVTESQLRALARAPAQQASAQASDADVQKMLAELMGDKPAAVSKCPRNGLLHIGDIDSKTAETFINTMTACQGRSVVIEVDSSGGEPFAAWGMQKAIERHDHTVFCVVDGLAASAAFMTLQSCTSRYMTSRSILMMHTGSRPVSRGHENDIRNAADELHALDESMSAFCGKRMGLTMDQFYAHISGGREWWMSMPEALKQHAIDGEAESVKEILSLIGH